LQTFNTVFGVNTCCCVVMQVHELPQDKLSKRDVIHLDIVNDSVSPGVSWGGKFEVFCFI